MKKSEAQKWLDKMHSISNRIEESCESITDAEKEIKRAKKEFDKLKYEWINYLIEEADAG